ncbi:MAG: LD-carboxypeptidase [Rickettsiales bacterium]|nr:LD-carboxypeptidase [Rickettsiales bacterium]
MQLKIKLPEFWPNLENEDKIYVISPGYKANDINKNDIIKFLANWHLKPIFYENNEKSNEPFLAHNDTCRFDELKNALTGNESNLIIALKGGYGSARLIPDLIEQLNPAQEKLLIGFSDITSLHLAFNNYFKLSSLHAPMLEQMIKGTVSNESITTLLNILKKQTADVFYPITALNQIALDLKAPKNFANLIGGNLSLIQTSIGTKWQLNTQQKFSVLIEEYDEELYAMDRKLNHLIHSSYFRNCEALFIGDISQKDNQIDQTSLEYLSQHLIKKLEIPIFRIENIGHTKSNKAIPLGLEIAILS